MTPQKSLVIFKNFLTTLTFGDFTVQLLYLVWTALVDTANYNVDEVLREAINALKNDSRFLSITIQPENYDEKTSAIIQPVSCPVITQFELRSHLLVSKLEPLIGQIVILTSFIKSIFFYFLWISFQIVELSVFVWVLN